MYRNKGFYLKMLKGRTTAWAYEYIAENLKRPSFVHEARNAYDAYKEVYGIEFASPEEMQKISDKEKIARLEAELEKVQIEKRQAAMGQTETEPNPDGFEDNTTGDATNSGGDNTATGDAPDGILTKEQFTEQFIRDNGKDVPPVRGRAWKKYAKAHGIEE